MFLTGSPVERRLAAILAGADVEGYSRLMGADAAGTLRDLTQRRPDCLLIAVGSPIPLGIVCWPNSAAPSMQFNAPSRRAWLRALLRLFLTAILRAFIIRSALNSVC